MKKSIIRITCFILVLALILCYVNKVLSFKYSDGISQITNFYEQDDNSIDVLLVGSSHSFVNFNNAELYEDYGIASYNLGSANQPLWNSYYYIKEALKTQTPELIVLEGYALTFDDEYNDTNSAIRNSFGLKWSKNKVENILASVNLSNMSSFILEYSRYHSRYNELDAGDFVDAFGTMDMSYNWYDDSWKGQYLFYNENPIVIEDVKEVNSKIDLLDKTEEYYRKIIELAKNKNIPIVVIIVPCETNEYQQKKYNTAKDIATEYGVNFLNGNVLLEEIGINTDKDYVDHSHMNVKGSWNFSKYIGNYLKENYEICDRRGDPKYQSWQDHVEYVHKFIEDGELSNLKSVDELPRYLKSSESRVIISIDGYCDSSNENIRPFLEELSIYDEQANGIWLLEDGKITWNSVTDENEKYLTNQYHDFLLVHNWDDGTNEVLIDNKTYKRVENGVNITVYDTKTNAILSTMGIDMDDGYKIVK